MREVFGILAFITMIGLLFYINFTEDGKKEYKMERNINNQTQEIITKSNNKKNEYFCEEYKKIVPNKNDAPYGYRHCY